MQNQTIIKDSHSIEARKLLEMLNEYKPCFNPFVDNIKLKTILEQVKSFLDKIVIESEVKYEVENG